MGWFKKDKPSEAGGAATVADHAEATSGTGLFGRLRKGLSKTRDILNTDIEDIFRGRRKIDDEVLEDIEELLITADIGVETTMALMERVHERSGSIRSAQDLKDVLKIELSGMMTSPPVR